MFSVTVTLLRLASIPTCILAKTELCAYMYLKLPTSFPSSMECYVFNFSTVREWSVVASSWRSIQVLLIVYVMTEYPVFVRIYSVQYTAYQHVLTSQVGRTVFEWLAWLLSKPQTTTWPMFCVSYQDASLSLLQLTQLCILLPASTRETSCDWLVSSPGATLPDPGNLM